MLPNYFHGGAIVSTDKDHVVIAQGERVWKSQPQPGDKPWFYFPDFFLKNPKTWFQHSEYQQVSVKELFQQLEEEHVPQNFTWKRTGETIYGTEFEKLKRSFRLGSLKKAVPYLFYTSQGLLKIQDSLNHLLVHALKYPTFLYGFWSEGEGMLGGTPELLFTIDKFGLLTTAAIAGTTTPEEENRLLTDPKLIEEHSLVVEGISKSLAPFGKVTVGETHILSLAHLSHAKALIEVKLSQPYQIDQIVQVLHPTPALGAYPKSKGEQWLGQYNQFIPRGRYGAPVGIKLGNSFHCYVAIRNLQWYKQKLSIGVGGGVVERSQKEDEMQELSLKFQATRTMLGV